MKWETSTPIYMLGNSAVLAFSDLLWHQGEQLVSTCTCYCPHLQLTNFSHRQQLHPGIIQALLAESLLAPTQTSRTIVQDHLVGQYLFMDTQTSHTIAQLESQTTPSPMVTFESIYLSNATWGDPVVQGWTQKQSPPLVVVCGHTPAFIIDGTFEMPLEVVTAFGLNPVSFQTDIPTYQWEQVWQQAQVWLDPFCEGLLLLKNMGFSALYLHSIPAMNASDRQPELVLLNAVLADFCHRHQISFLNLWPVWQTEGLGLEITPHTARRSMSYFLSGFEC